MVMNQTKKEVHGQVLYKDRWVDKSHFRAFVYNVTDQKLANSFNEYEQMIASGLWFNTKEDALNAVKVEEEPKTKKEIRAEKVEKIAKEIKEKTSKSDIG